MICQIIEFVWTKKLFLLKWPLQLQQYTTINDEFVLILYDEANRIEWRNFQNYKNKKQINLDSFVINKSIKN